MTNNFSRSNVNEKTLQITQPNRSSFTLSHNLTFTPMMGRLHPIMCESLMPSDVFSGSLNPNLSLEPIITPSIGRVRLDTHTFVVSARRINKDMKFFVEGKQGYTTLPTFGIRTLATAFLHKILGTSEGEVIADLAFYGNDYDAFVSKFIDQFTSYYNSQIQQVLDPGYKKDFLKLEIERLSQIKQIAGTLTFAQVLYECLMPFFGINSNLDMLGYPLPLRPYSLTYEQLSVIKPWTGTTPLYWTNFGSVEISHLMFIKSHTNNFDDYSTIDDMLVSEMQLRAAYACWYDYFRDYHIEKSDNILDPDTFGSSPILVSTSLSQMLSNMYMLLVPRWRYWSRDIITTIQPDDIYRKVYAPVMLSDDTNSTSEFTSLPSAPVDQQINTIGSIISDYISTSFPAGTLFSETMQGQFKSCLLDLQTLKRSKMLEKWLARNYYYPDNFSGAIEGHYGVKPSDYNILVSHYIGGDESFIDGQQNIAPVETPDTPIGTRTMYAGAQLTDKFNYSVQDFSYLVSFVSLVPLVTYDSLNSHVLEITNTDLPYPEYAQDSRIAVKASQLLRGFEEQNNVVGYVPRYYQYRTHADETHGRYLTDRRLYGFMRDWKNMTPFDGTGVLQNIPRNFALNPYSLRIHPNLDAFAGITHEQEPIAYGNVDIQLYVDRPLPAAVEIL